jgi:hypothetical protein
LSCEEEGKEHEKKKSENFYELGDGKTVGKNTNLIVQLCGTSHETHVDFISE